jgi:transposase
MGWYRVALAADERAVVNAERDSHPDAHVRRKMLVLWLLHHGLTRVMAAEVAGVGRATVQRYVAAYRDGGLNKLRHWGVTGPVTELAAHTEATKTSLAATPVRTVAEACERIAAVTGVRRRPTQVRAFLAGLGFRWRRVRAVPVPPKRTSPATSPTRRRSLTPT